MNGVQAKTHSFFGSFLFGCSGLRKMEILYGYFLKCAQRLLSSLKKLPAGKRVLWLSFFRHAHSFPHGDTRATVNRILKDDPNVVGACVFVFNSNEHSFNDVLVMVRLHHCFAGRRVGYKTRIQRIGSSHSSSRSPTSTWSVRENTGEHCVHAARLHGRHVSGTVYGSRLANSEALHLVFCGSRQKVLPW